MLTIGIDVAKAHFQAAFEHNGRWRERRFSNDEPGVAGCQRWLAEREVTGEAVAVVMEATGIYSEPLAERFYARGYEVFVLNPAQVKALAQSRLQRGKTDRVDARLLTAAPAAIQAPHWRPTSAAVRELRELRRHLNGLETSRAQLANRRETQHSASTQDSLTRVLECLDAEITTTRAALDERIATSHELREAQALLRSIPAVGARLTGELLVRLPKLQQSQRAASLVAHAGLDPRAHQSGSSINAPRRISKCGDAALRKALYFPAICALRHNPVVRAHAERLRRRGVTGKALVCAAARKLLHLIHGVLKSQKPFDANIPLHAPG